jgi:hypothetical protein
VSARRAGPATLSLLAIAAGTGGIIVGWGAYALVAWLGYGRLGIDRRPDRLLDRFIPEYEVAERHETRVAAPGDVTYQAACDFDLRESPLIRTIFRARELLLGAPAAPNAPSRLLELTLQAGWRTLAEDPGRELVVGTITRPWEARVSFHPLAPDVFAAFDEPGYVKIVWTVCVDPVEDRSSVFRTVTRVQTTDTGSREKFRRYWAVFSPGILLIRYEVLRIVRAVAARRAFTSNAGR